MPDELDKTRRMDEATKPLKDDLLSLYNNISASEFQLTLPHISEAQARNAILEIAAQESEAFVQASTPEERQLLEDETTLPFPDNDPDLLEIANIYIENMIPNHTHQEIAFAIARLSYTGLGAVSIGDFMVQALLHDATEALHTTEVDLKTTGHIKSSAVAESMEMSTKALFMNRLLDTIDFDR